MTARLTEDRYTAELNTPKAVAARKLAALLKHIEDDGAEDHRIIANHVTA